jgi:spermidine/putrescine transport system substrate-binding protein
MIRGRRAIGRRAFLAQAGALGAGGLSLGSWIGCGRDEGTGNRLFVENWPAYIDSTTDEGPGSVDRFRAATGIDLRYSETINDNQEYFARIQPRLGTGRTIEADVIVPSGWLAARLIRLGWVDPLPLDRVANRVNLDPLLRNQSWDPTGEYSLPWQTVVTGIAYNRNATGRDLKGVADLFDPRLKGRIGMLTEMRDTIGLLLLGLGIDPASIASFAHAARAFDQLERVKADGQIRAFTGNDYVDDLSTGNFAACMAWQGDALLLARDNPAIRFIIPDEGGLVAVDTMVMPKGARHREAAARWFDFVYEPATAARINAQTGQLSPVVGVQAEMATIDAGLAAHPLLFPDAAMRARLHSFATLDEDVEAEFDETFSRIIGA